jgi:transcriptional regulator with XRE-family HTH domain
MTPINFEKFGKALDAATAATLRRLRGERGLSRPQLARSAGMGLKTVQRFEEAKRSPDLRQTAALCMALGVRPADFVEQVMGDLGELIAAAALTRAELEELARRAAPFGFKLSDLVELPEDWPDDE